MINTSAAFKEACKTSHRIAILVEILKSGTVEASSDRGSAPIHISAISGNVGVDRGSGIRRRCTGRFIDPDGVLTPNDTTSLMAPLGTEVRFQRGIVFTDGSREMVDLGTFFLEEPEIEDSGDSLTIKFEGYDSSVKIGRNRWTETYVISNNTNIITALEGLIANRLPGTTFVSSSSTYATPLIVLGEQADNDPWEDARRIAQSAGLEIFFNASKQCVIQPEPDPTSVTDAQWDFVEGPGGTLLWLSRTFSNERTYNGAIVRGENSGNAAPIRAESWDTDQNSPTYYLGEYGKVPTFGDPTLISLIKTQDQAQAAADALVLNKKGLLDRLRATAMVMPALEPGDVARVTRERAKVDGLYMIESLNIPLEASNISNLSFRERRV